MPDSTRRTIPLVVVVLSMALAGCSAPGFNNPFSGFKNPFVNPFKKEGPPPEPNVLPTNYKSKLLDLLQTQLTDPFGVRDAYITEPKLQPVGSSGESRYVVCVRYNAKDGYGQYTGIEDNIAVYFNGQIAQYVPATQGQCRDAAYVRFPELEALKRPGN